MKLQRGIPYSPRGCAAPGKVPCQGNTQECLSKLKATSSLRKIVVTCKSPVGDISAVTLIRTDTTLDHSQKAEKIWLVLLASCACAYCCAQVACLRFAFGGVAFALLRAPLRQLYMRNVALHCWAERSPRQNCKNDLDDQTLKELE